MNSFAEILAEASQFGLSGSFRLASEAEKAIVYINNGEVVFAVSNLRQHRLFEILLRNNLIQKDRLTEFANFTNDMEFAEYLTVKGFLTKSQIDESFGKQIGEIVLNILDWKSGIWSFSHLARAKENIQFPIDTKTLLIAHARMLPDEYIVGKFKSFDERFAVVENASLERELLPQEVFIFSRLNTTAIKIEEIKHLCGFTNAELLKTLYSLWMAGFVSRNNWYPAFPAEKVRGILDAKLTLKKEAAKPIIKTSAETLEETEENSDDLLEIEVDEKTLLTRYLDDVEKAESFYEILDVDIKAGLSEIKAAYFRLAKQYHPDRFHNDADRGLRQRIQDAFTELARAYETLKDDKARELYDFKLRKYLETIKDRPTNTVIDETPLVAKTNFVDNAERAREEFEQGFNLLMQNSPGESIPYLTRAVQMDSSVAKYHAYYGKALSSEDNQRHKAEAAIRSAIKLDPANVAYRIMLAEFYIQFNLLKRAEGELQRLLVQFPGNREAKSLLDTL